MSITTPDSGTVTFVDRDGRALHVFRTEDGGRTWDGPRLNSVPDGMDGITGGFGPDTGVVWSSNGQADGQPFDDRLAFSIDGWATFRETRFPIDSHAPAGVLKNVVAVRADASGHMLLAIDVDGGSRAIYSSTDFGQSWSFLKDAANHEVDFLSMTDWVLTSEDPTGTWWTTDGGCELAGRHRWIARALRRHRHRHRATETCGRSTTATAPPVRSIPGRTRTATDVGPRRSSS